VNKSRSLRMLERSRLHYVLAAALILALASTWSGAVGAAPSPQLGPEPVVTITQSLASVESVGPVDALVSVDGPEPRFGFSSVLNQAATSVAKTVTSVSGTAIGPANTTNAGFLVPGDIVTFTVNVSNLQRTTTPVIQDFLSPNLTLCVAGTNCGNLPVTTSSSCVVAVPQPAGRPAGVSPASTVINCTPTVTGGAATVTIQAVVNENAVPGVDPALNVACAQGATGSFITGSFCAFTTGTIFDQAQVQKFITSVDGVPLPPGTTSAQNLQPGDIVVFQVNVTNAGGGVTPLIRDFLSPNLIFISGDNCVQNPNPGTARPTGVAPNSSVIDCNPPVTTGTASFSFQATVSNNAALGGDPALNVACAATRIFTPITGTTLFTSTTSFTAATSPCSATTGTILVPGIPPFPGGQLAIPQVAIPAVPRPPVQFIPNPPPPLLPPTGPIPSLQRPPAYPEVPVIPEADTVGLLAGGLLALGAFAVLRARRRRDG
jgi:hypothetical protein